MIVLCGKGYYHSKKSRGQVFEKRLGFVSTRWYHYLYDMARQVNAIAERCQKQNNKWGNIQVNQPQVIQQYNTNVGGVDLSDQQVTT